jgi:hypothetical protein
VDDDRDLSNQDRDKGKDLNHGIEKYGYLVGIVQDIDKLQELELQNISRRFADWKAKVIGYHLYLESQNDKIKRE